MEYKENERQKKFSSFAKSNKTFKKRQRGPSPIPAPVQIEVEQEVVDDLFSFADNPEVVRLPSPEEGVDFHKLTLNDRGFIDSIEIEHSDGSVKEEEFKGYLPENDLDLFASVSVTNDFSYVAKEKPKISMFKYDPVEEKFDMPEDIAQAIPKGRKRNKTSAKKIVRDIRKRQSEKEAEKKIFDGENKKRTSKRQMWQKEKEARLDGEPGFLDFKNVKTTSRRGKPLNKEPKEQKRSNHEIWNHRAAKKEVNESKKKERRKRRGLDQDEVKVSDASIVRTKTQDLTHDQIREVFDSVSQEGEVVETKTQDFSWTERIVKHRFVPLTLMVEEFAGRETVALTSFIVNFVRLVRELSADIPSSTKSTLLVFWLQTLGVGFVESNLVGEAVSLIISSAPAEKKFVRPASEGPIVFTKTQALSDELDKLGDVLEYTFNSSFSTAVQTLMVYGTMTTLVPESMRLPIHKWLGRPDPKMTLLYIVEMCIKACARIVKVVEMLVSGKPWSEAILHRDPLLSNKMLANQLLMQKDHLYTGIKVEGKYNRYTWCEQASTCINYFSHRLKCSNASRPEYLELQRYHTQLSASYSSVKDTLNGGFRRMPFGVILGQDPGIGKSRLIDLTLMSWSVLSGMKFSGDMVYHVDTTSEYFEGYVNQPYIHYPELGTETKKIAENRGSETIMAMTSIMDSQPKCASMAFENKGKIWLAPEVVICDTNNFSMNFDQLVCNPAAFRRRFYYCKFEVLEKYRKVVGDQLTSAIDTTKIREDPPKHPSDIYLVDIWVEQCLNPKESLRQYIMSNGSIYDYVNKMRELMQEHMDNQKFVEKNHHAMADVFGEMKQPGLVDHNALDKPPATPADGFIKGINSIVDKVKVATSSVIKDPKCMREIMPKISFREYFREDKFDPGFGGDEKDIEMMPDVSTEPIPVPAKKPHAVVEEKYLTPPIDDFQISFVPSESTPLVGDFLGEEKDVQTQTQSGRTWVKLFQSKKYEGRTDFDVYNWDKIKASNNYLIDIKDVEKLYDRVLTKSVIYTSLVGETYLVIPEEGLDFVNFAESDYLSVFRSFTPRKVAFCRNVKLHKKRPLMSTAGDIDLVSDSSRLPRVDMEYASVAECAVFDAFRYWVFFATFFRCQYESSQLAFPYASFVYRFLYLTFGLFFYSFLSPIFGGILFTFICGMVETFIHFNGRSARNLFWRFIGVSTTIDYALLNKIAKVAGALTAAAGGVALAIKFSRVTKVKSKAQENAELKEFEERVNAGDGFVRKDCKSVGRAQYERAGSIDHSTQNTDDVEKAFKTFSSNQRFVSVLSTREDGMQIRSKGFLYGLKGDFVVMNSHYFAHGHTFELDICEVSGGVKSQQVRKVIVHKDQIYFPPETDLAFFRALCLQFRDKVAFFSSTPKHDKVGRGVFKSQVVKWEYGVIRTANNVNDYGDVFPVTSPIKVHYRSQPGDCGLILVSETVKSNYIIGIHCGGGEEKDGSLYGVVSTITRGMVNDAISYLEARVPLIKANSVPDEVVFIGIEDLKQSDLVEPNIHSPFVHEPFENIRYLGSTGKNVHAKQKSALVKSVFCDDDEIENETMEKFVNVFGPIKKLFGKPMMAPKKINGEYTSPFNLNLRKTNNKSFRFSPKDCIFVANYLSNHLISRLEKKGLKRMDPLKISVSLNGAKLDDFFDGIKLSTSAGFGFKGSKKDHIYVDEDGIRHLNPEVEEALLRAVQSMLKGEKPGFVHTVALKDEPRPLEKCRCGKTRCFFMTNLVNLVLARMFLGPLYSTMVSHCDAFYAAIGTDAHRDFGHMRDHLINFSDLLMEGDYGGYDVSMPVDISLVTNTVIHNILAHFGYSQEALLMVEGLLDEAMHLTYEMNGDLYQVDGKQPSGRYGTAEDNSIRNLVILLFFWYTHPELKKLDFFTYVLPLVYGDDCIVAVKKEVAHWMNNIEFAKFVESIGMEFTTAGKGAVENPFVSFDEVSFLKRVFAYKEDLHKYVGPLDTDSIFKMTQWREPSKIASPAVQTASTVSSILRESFFHLNRQKYDSWRAYLWKIYDDKFGMTEDVEKSSFPSYDYLISDLGVKDVEIEAQCSSHSVNETSELPTVGWSINKPCELGTSRMEVSACLDNFVSSAESMENNLRALYGELKEAESHLESLQNPFPGVNPSQYYLVDLMQCSPATMAIAKQYRQAYHQVRSIEATIDILSSSLNRKKINVTTHTQSENIPIVSKGTVDGPTEETHQNITDIGGMETKDFSMGIAYDASNDTDLPVGEFFSRPIEISVLSIPLSSEFAALVEPFTIITNDPSFRAKSRNYGFFRGNVKLRIALSGSLNHYGRVMLAYIPMAEFNSVAQFYATLNPAYRFQLKSYLSQVKGAVVMDVADNMPVEMECGYLSFNPMARLFNESTLAISGDFNDFAVQGYLFVCVLNPIECVNNVSATPISLQIYGWMENVSIAQTTGTVVSITTESKELKVGVVQKTASAARQVSRALTSVPFIAPFAKASELGFSSLEKFAALFGWSAPMVAPSENKPMHIKPDAFQNAVNTITYNMGKKMTMDPLQEISVDPRIVGSTEDEMSVGYLARRWSLLDQFTWTPDDSPLSTILWRTGVHPMMVKKGPAADGKAFFQPTALGFAAAPWYYWSGSIEFEVEFVTSRYHRGKPIIMFDPNIAQYVIITSSLKMNKQNAVVMDLQETNKATFCIHFSRHRLWQRCNTNNSIVNRMVGSALFTDFTPDQYEKFVSGFLIITPFTKLQSPDDSSIAVNVYVRAGEDFAVNQLQVANLPTVRTTTQSNSATVEPSTCYEMNEQVLDHTHRCTLHYGEQPLSFRSYLKRFYTTKVLTDLEQTTGSFNFTGLYLPDNANPWGTAGGATMDLMSWLRPAFIGYRGSVRKRLRLQGSHFAAGDHVKVYQPLPSQTVVTPAITTIGVPSVFHSGVATFVPFTNAGVEVELPFYSPSLFWPAGVDTAAGMLALTSQTWDRSQTYNYSAIFEMTGDNVPRTLNLFEETSYGDDSSLVHFIAAAPFVATDF
nr:MAG: polyprotein [Marnaviridae sp.]